MGLLGMLYHMARFPERSSLPVVVEELVPPPDFAHPLENESWWYKLTITTKRLFYLTLLFMPCATIGLVVQFTNNEEWRKYWLELLVRTFEAAGCGFQKFGQWMSMRPDMFPRDVVEAMSKLRDDIPAHDIAHTRKMIRESFGGREIEDIFEHFEPTCIASGSVAQVHRARLKPEYAINGTIQDVAVKVRHPSVLEETFVDVDLLFKLVNGSNLMTVPFEKQQFLTSLRKQIDFEWEAYSLAKFAQNFTEEISRGDVRFPIVSRDLLSPSVLVESWAQGNTITNFFANVGSNFHDLASDVSATVKRQRTRLAEQVFSVCMKMFIRDNYMHGDLHGGNLLYDEVLGTVTVIDAGHTTSLDPHHTHIFGKFMRGLIAGDSESIVDCVLKFNENDNAEVDRPKFTAEVDSIVRRFMAPNGRGHDGSPVCIGDIVGKMLFSLHDYKISLRGDVACSLVSIAVSEGLIRQLDPNFDMNMKALPYLAKYGTQFA